MRAEQAVAHPVPVGTAVHTTPRVERWGWGWPRWNDPRIPFAAILTLYGVLGFSFFGFNRSPWQMASSSSAAACWTRRLGWLLRREKVVPPERLHLRAARWRCCSTTRTRAGCCCFRCWLTIGSKYVLTFEGRHVFNPSMFGVATSLLAHARAHHRRARLPVGQWRDRPLGLHRHGRAGALLLPHGPHLAGAQLPLLLRAADRPARLVLRHHLPPEVLFLGTLGAPAFFIFTFYMITDPATSPKTPRGQVLLALALTLVDLVLHLRRASSPSSTRPSPCAHGALPLPARARALWRRGPSRTSRASSRPGLSSAWRRWEARGRRWPRATRSPWRRARLSARCPSAWSAWRPRTRASAPPWGTARRAWTRACCTSPSGCSRVGDAVAAGDFDGDGKLDLFLTNPLKSDADRAALYRNLGDLRFERVKVPALERLAASYHHRGRWPPAGTFVDYDGDGDQDLAVAVAFGPSRLLRNPLRETGTAGFEDVTQRAGLGDALGEPGRHVPRLRPRRAPGPLRGQRAHHAPARLRHAHARSTSSGCRSPSIPGDRRMLRFMHDGWHNADNGGLNALYRAPGDGTFEKLDSAALGLTETHWSLAVSTVDLNQRRLDGPLRGQRLRSGRRLPQRAGQALPPRRGEAVRRDWQGHLQGHERHRGGLRPQRLAGRVRVQRAPLAPGRGQPAVDGVAGRRTPSSPSFKDEATFRGALNERRFGWGAAAGDLDNDGWPDIVQANGMVDDRLDRRYDSARARTTGTSNHKLMQSGPEVHTYADKWGDIRGRTIYPNEPRRVYLNLGDAAPGHFVDVAKQVGTRRPGQLARRAARGPGQRWRPGRWSSPTSTGPCPCTATPCARERGRTRRTSWGSRWWAMGSARSRGAVGTRVVVSYEEGGRRIEQVRRGGADGGLLSASADPRLHFGLGRHAGPVKATIHWYGGEAQTVRLEADRYHVLRQPVSTAGLRDSR